MSFIFCYFEISLHFTTRLFSPGHLKKHKNGFDGTHTNDHIISGDKANANCKHSLFNPKGCVTGLHKNSTKHHSNRHPY